MTRWTLVTLTLLAAALIACGPAVDLPWFDGDVEQALEAANKQETLVFVQFKAEWCSWCKRLETETLTDPDVLRRLDTLVTLQLDAENGGAEAARRYAVESYPTMLFLDPAGEEVERIVGYLPPEKLVNEIDSILAGDTLHACLQKLHDDPADPDAIRRVVEELLERSDPEGAIAKIKKFHSSEGHDHQVCKRLMFLAGRDLHYRAYLKTAKLYRGGWKKTIDVPSVPGIKRLSELMDGELLEMDASGQAATLRTARHEDAAELLELVDVEATAGNDLFGLGTFAFRGGHYRIAAELYGRWFSDESAVHDADTLNRAAWQLYLARESLDTAVTMARKAHALEPSPDITDTLARLIYVTGSADEAITLELEAAWATEGEQAASLSEAVEIMKAGGDLGDEPAFETFPGPREISL